MMKVTLGLGDTRSVVDTLNQAQYGNEMTLYRLSSDACIQEH